MGRLADLVVVWFGWSFVSFWERWGLVSFGCIQPSITQTSSSEYQGPLFIEQVNQSSRCTDSFMQR